MLDAPYSRPDKSAFDIDWIGVKASQFSFSRLHKADPVLGVDMSSTGEVGCIGDDFSEALLNSMIAPEENITAFSGILNPVAIIEFSNASEKSSPIHPTSPVEDMSTPNTGSALCRNINKNSFSCLLDKENSLFGLSKEGVSFLLVNIAHQSVFYIGSVLLLIND